MILATPALMIGASEKTPKVILDWVLCIHFPVQFCKNKKIIKALIAFGSKINVIIPAYAKQLDFQIHKTNIETQKIDNLLLKTFEMVIASFQVVDKLGRVPFFQKTFLLANTSMKVVLKMFFSLLVMWTSSLQIKNLLGDFIALKKPCQTLVK